MRFITICSWMLAFTSFTYMTSCNNGSLQEKLNKKFALTLESSRDIAYTHTEDIERALEDRRLDSHTKTKADYWDSIFKKVSLQLDLLYQRIQVLKMEITDAQNLEASQAIQFDSLSKMVYDSILNIHPRIKHEFSHTLPYTPFNEFQKSLKQYPVSAISALLTAIETDFANAKNRLIYFCFIQTSSNATIVHTFQLPLISQSHKLVSPGDTIKISAGIGVFMKSNNPTFILDGHNVAVNEYGFVVQNIKASLSLGEHKIPIKITYIDEEGKDQKVEKYITYRVIRCVSDSSLNGK